MHLRKFLQNFSHSLTTMASNGVVRPLGSGGRHGQPSVKKLVIKNLSGFDMILFFLFFIRRLSVDVPLEG